MNEANENEIEYLSTSEEISEEDNEDYNIDETDEENNDNYNEDEDEDINNMMQVDIEEGLSKEIVEGLKLLHLKSLYNFTEAAYNDIIKLFANKNISLYKIKKILEEITGLIPKFYDMCENSCICYTGLYETYQSCPLCNSLRYDSKNKSKKVMPYLSIKKRLEIQYNNKIRAEELLYRYRYITNKEIESEDLEDIFDGNMYKDLLEKDFFSDQRDIAFTVSCDGYQIFKQKTDDCWLFLLINNNLDPSIRVKKENLLIPFLIPEPNQPKDFNTFLRPFINEMKELESK